MDGMFSLIPLQLLLLLLMMMLLELCLTIWLYATTNDVNCMVTLFTTRTTTTITQKLFVHLLMYLLLMDVGGCCYWNTSIRIVLTSTQFPFDPTMVVLANDNVCGCCRCCCWFFFCLSFHQTIDDCLTTMMLLY